ncbi:N-terminal kinase-like protein [Watersipora subatra]|uniref:N-terminal kinase-like protein n=1 Tax=Watersipora subatra TaxID=2589382 RepID=UPI00355C13E2
MWSIFSRDPASSFSYEILEFCSGLEDKSLWRLHKGKKKTTGDECSIFVFELKNASEAQAQVAKASFKRMKTLRHPNLVTYVDGLESDKVLYVVTEPVMLLTTYLNQHESEGSRNEFAISWGIFQVTKGLSFLNNDCGLVHNNMCLTSVFVNKAGEWLLGGLEYMYPTRGEHNTPPIKILPLLEKYDPPERVTQKLSAKTDWSVDMWGLGCLIWEVFNGPLNRTADLKSVGKLPKSITGSYATLVSANPKTRPNPTAFLETCQKPGGFMANKFIEAMLFVEQIQIKDQAQKTEFLESLNSEIDNFPSSFCIHKILPQLIKAFEYGDAGANILTPLLKVGKMLSAEEYQRQVVPCIVKMFSITDRQTRVRLLQQMNLYIEHIPVVIVNEKLYPSISMGFNDTNPLVRETTIKAMLHMASKLNYKNLNEDLMKHFARLQSKDEQGGIRTNTTVCLGKIACYLNPQIRQKVLPSAYTRALKDPFTPARQATLLAMSASVQYFPIQDLAGRLLPSICPLTRDPEKSVRDQAFSVMESFIERLKKVSEDPEVLVEMEKELTSSSATASESQSWTGWAMTAGVTSLSSLSSFTSKFKSRQQAGSDSAAAPEVTSQTSPSEQPVSASTNRPKPATQKAPNNEGLGGESSLWNDDEDWGTINDPPADKPKSSKSAWEETDADNWGSSWDDGESEWKDTEEEFEPIEATSDMATASAYNWDSHSKEKVADDFFSSIASETKPSVKSKTTNVEQKSDHVTADGWGADDGWGASDNWNQPPPATSIHTAEEAERKKKEREEKRQERQRAMAARKATPKTGGRALKLGAKKMAQD